MGLRTLSGMKGIASVQEPLVSVPLPVLMTKGHGSYNQEFSSMILYIALSCILTALRQDFKVAILPE